MLERLLFLILPRLYTHLYKNQVLISYFASPYFITLLTNIYTYGNEKVVLFLTHFFGDFIFNGFKSIFEVILVLLKYHETEILSLGTENLVDFLIVIDFFFLLIVFVHLGLQDVLYPTFLIFF